VIHLGRCWTGRRWVNIGRGWLAVGFGPVALVERVWWRGREIYRDHVAHAEGVRRRGWSPEVVP